MIDIKQFSLGPLETNCYVVHNDTQAIVIDPGGDPREVVEYLQFKNLKLTHIINTHLHFDHIQGNAALQRATQVPILASSKDGYLLDTELGGGGMMGFPLTEKFEFEPLTKGEMKFLDMDCQVFATPGHSPGSMSFYFPELEAVFVGDLIFYRSVGRTDFPGGNSTVLRMSAEKYIFTLPDKTVIYSGHGPETNVGEEKRQNPFFGGFAL